MTNIQKHTTRTTKIVVTISAQEVENILKNWLLHEHQIDAQEVEFATRRYGLEVVTFTRTRTETDPE